MLDDLDGAGVTLHGRVDPDPSELDGGVGTGVPSRVIAPTAARAGRRPGAALARPIATSRDWPSWPPRCRLASYRFAATHGTAAALRAQGHAVREVGRLGEDGGRDPDMLAAIASGELRFVVNTPSPEPGVVSDAARIRHTTVAEGILCFTTIETAIEAARSLDPAVVAACSDVRPLGEWQGMTGSAGPRTQPARRSLTL